MSDQSRVPVMHSAPSSRQTVKVLTATTVCVSLLFLFGLTLTVTVIGLAVATPLLVLFSPILVPAVIALFLVASGFAISCGNGVVAITVLSWLYSYVTGKHPPGSDTLVYVRMKIANIVRKLKEKAKEYGQNVQNKTEDTMDGS